MSVARHLAAAGAPIVAPWGEPGPHVANGLEVSLWCWVEHSAAEVAQADFGRLLGTLHDSLSDCPVDLPLLAGPLADIAAALAVSSNETLHRASASLLPLSESWPRRPLHGDAHTGNVLVTPTGPLWTDFRTCAWGPWSGTWRR